MLIKILKRIVLLVEQRYKKTKYYQHKRLVKLLDKVSESVEVERRANRKFEREHKERNDKERIDSVLCMLKPTKQSTHWVLEFVNRSSSPIRVIKVSAESYFAVLINPYVHEPEHPGVSYKRPTPNPSDEIFIRNLEADSSITFERVLPYVPTIKQNWMRVQMSCDLDSEATFPIKQIRVILDA